MSVMKYVIRELAEEGSLFGKGRAPLLDMHIKDAV